jgi:hypothetical protein
VCKVVFEGADLVRGLQHIKDQYVSFTEEELESLEAEANKSINLKEFIPLASVDPVCIENTHTSAPIKAARSFTGCSLMPWPAPSSHYGADFASFTRSAYFVVFVCSFPHQGDGGHYGRR